ncbi:hypothetical protein TIFTF001_023540 [Ficus carica]|uniref:Uncharacterized protein n=1 Tax=Ficus carica TaxID=3494 RepID=A0AA88B047_FICCA|nr:hypothetical protein TIFTF001_023540 [Ficus carica]
MNALIQNLLSSLSIRGTSRVPLSLDIAAGRGRASEMGKPKQSQCQPKKDKSEEEVFDQALKYSVNNIRSCMFMLFNAY